MGWLKEFFKFYRKITDKTGHYYDNVKIVSSDDTLAMEICGAEKLCQYLDILKDRIKSLPERAAECHSKSEAGKSLDHQLAQDKYSALNSVDEIKDLFMSYVPKDYAAHDC